MGYTELKIEGRNPVIEAYRSGKTIDKLFVLDGCQDGPVKTITREARKQHTIISYVSKERLDQLSETHHHQGVIAIAAAYDYASVDDILAKAREKVKHLLSFFWMALKIRTTWVLSSEQRILPVPTVSSFRSTAP